MPAPVLQFKRGNAGVAGTVPALRPGEPAISLNNFDFFIGIDTSVANNKFFGSHRYWGREDGTNSLRFKLVDKDGTNHIALKSPDTLAGIVTYTLPETINNGYFLKTNATGELSWAEVVSNINIAADTGTTDNVSTGATITFTGGTNVNTAVTNDTITINLDDNINVSGVSTFASGAVIDSVQVGITTGKIETTSGKLSLTSATGTVEVTSHLDVIGDLDVTGNVYIGGTTVTLRGTDVFIENKDIVLGYTTTTNPNDTTANHAGVAIASTEGTPLTSFSASGINTLPDTYKQMMWFRSGTLGFATDAFAFNYGVAIGTTTMANGVRLAVGSGITMSDTAVSATNFYGAFNGNASSADQVKTVTAGDAAGTYYVTFVNSLNGSATNETVYTDDGIYYNPGTNTFTTQHALFTGNVEVQGTLTGTATTATRANSVDVVGVATNQNYYITLVDSSGNSKSIGVDSEFLYNPNTNTFTVGTGVGVTQFSSSVSTGSSTSSVPTSSAVINYVGTQIGNIDLTLGINADTGGPSTVSTSQTLTISGTASEVNTSVSGQTITVGLPDDVIVGTSLSAPTVRTNLIKSQDTNETAITIAGNDVTIAGDLYVNGSTTQINTTSITVEDRTIELGMVDGSAPSSATTWDLGVFFNYYTDSAKKSALVWEHSVSRFQLGSVVSDGGGTGNDNPQLTVSTFAPIEVAELWVNNSCTGGAQQVIGCVSSELRLQNITIDAGTF
jgi:hypothetical protein